MIKQNRAYRKRAVAAVVWKSLPACLSFISLSYFSAAQNCPPNIDFESGNFSGWTCYSGSVSAGGGTNTMFLSPSGGPVPNQHTMFYRGDQPAPDYYGGFPVVCPNGSGYSVKLGNNTGGAQAEGLAYEFTIPANRNTYSLIYNYAVVFQDPNHQHYQQPRLQLEITNLTDNEIIQCSSFTFFPNGSPLPGFFASPNSDSVTVWCKDWSAVSINLNGHAGKTIRLFFKTADCTFNRHFGYAYIDVNSECSSEFTGATFCRDDTAVTVTAPYGYMNYNWYNTSFTQSLGTGQLLYFQPPPPPGTLVAVELTPFNGYGCKDTLYARLTDTLTLRANAGPDAVYCNGTPELIGVNPKPGVVYSWTPATGLSNPAMANPLASPQAVTQYVLMVRSLGGGCADTDTVLVTPYFTDTALRLLGKNAYCITSNDSAVLVVEGADQVQWYRDNAVIPGAVQPRYRAPQSGEYYALLISNNGCSQATRKEAVLIETPRPGIRFPLKYAVMNTPVELQARDFGVTYLWRPAQFLNNPAIRKPVFSSPLVQDLQYTIDLISAGNCLTVDTQLVRTVKEVKVYVPTAFTPDNNGRNDNLRPIMMGIKEMIYFRIYNRWGQLVYTMQGDERGWNGMMGNQPQPTGTFVWIFQGVGADNRIYTQKGTSVLIR